MYPAPGIHMETVCIKLHSQIWIMDSSIWRYQFGTMGLIMFLLGPRSVTSLQLIQVMLVLDIMLNMQNTKTDHQQAVHCSKQTVDTSSMWERPPPTHSSIYSICNTLQDSHPRTRFASGEWLYPAPHVARARRQPAPRWFDTREGLYFQPRDETWAILHFFRQDIHEFYGSRCGSHLWSSKWINTSQN